MGPAWLGFGEDQVAGFGSANISKPLSDRVPGLRQEVLSPQFLDFCRVS
jgi:hypothetical protein